MARAVEAGYTGSLGPAGMFGISATATKSELLFVADSGHHDNQGLIARGSSVPVVQIHGE